jgi:hypothetical protein
LLCKHQGVSSFNIADDSFIVVEPAALAEVIADAERVAQWWPRMTLVLTRNRGPKGREWRVQGDWSGVSWTGSLEIWLEPNLDGVVLHHYVRWDPIAGPLSARDAARLTRRYATSWKRTALALKDELEAGRIIGEGPARG